MPSRVWKNISSTRVTPPTVSIEAWGSDPGWMTVSAFRFDAPRAGRPFSFSRAERRASNRSVPSESAPVASYPRLHSAAATDLGVGASLRRRIWSLRPVEASSFPTNCMARSECPPRSKKSSSAPTRPEPEAGKRTSSKSAATSSSASPSGATYAVTRASTSPTSRSDRSAAGAGRRFRSIFPFDVIGIPPGFTPTTALGIMYAGRRERSATRRVLAVPAGTIENAEVSEETSDFSAAAAAAAAFLSPKRSASARSAREVAPAPLLVSSRSAFAASSESFSSAISRGARCEPPRRSEANATGSGSGADVLAKTTSNLAGSSGVHMALTRYPSLSPRR